MLRGRIDGEIGERDSFRVVWEEHATHPVTLLFAHLAADRSEAVTRVRVRLSTEQAQVLIGQLQDVLCAVEAT